MRVQGSDSKGKKPGNCCLSAGCLYLLRFAMLWPDRVLAVMDVPCCNAMHLSKFAVPWPCRTLRAMDVVCALHG